MTLPQPLGRVQGGVVALLLLALALCLGPVHVHGKNVSAAEFNRDVSPASVNITGTRFTRRHSAPYYHGVYSGIMYGVGYLLPGFLVVALGLALKDLDVTITDLEDVANGLHLDSRKRFRTPEQWWVLELVVQHFDALRFETVVYTQSTPVEVPNPVFDANQDLGGFGAAAGDHANHGAEGDSHHHGNQQQQQHTHTNTNTNQQQGQGQGQAAPERTLQGSFSTRAPEKKVFPNCIALLVEEGYHMISAMALTVHLWLFWLLLLVVFVTSAVLDAENMWDCEDFTKGGRVRDCFWVDPEDFSPTADRWRFVDSCPVNKTAFPSNFDDGIIVCYHLYGGSVPHTVQSVGMATGLAYFVFLVYKFVSRVVTCPVRWIRRVSRFLMAVGALLAVVMMCIIEARATKTAHAVDSYVLLLLAVLPAVLVPSIKLEWNGAR